MTALYCYMVSYYNYNACEFHPIFHEQKFTKEEFREICNKIFNEIKDKEHNKWHWNYTRLFIEYAEKYGFKEIDILEVDTIDSKVRNYLEDEINGVI